MEIAHRPNQGMSRMFTPGGKPNLPVIAIFALINGLVAINVLIHNPKMGYDGLEHLKYIQVLPARLPVRADTYEFFSPPLPYILPAFFDKLCPKLLGEAAFGDPIFRDCDFSAAKFAQLINLTLSIGVTILLLAIAEKLKPGNPYFKTALLTMVGILPVYYKTFAQVRGEPYVFFFVALLIYLLLDAIYRPEQLSWKSGLQIGVILGLLILSRQWGFLLFPPIALLALMLMVYRPILARKILGVAAIALVSAFIVGGWFYLNNYRLYGTFTTFNQRSKGFSFSNQPASFYRNTGFQHLLLFRSPTRPTFDNQLLPILYSETWGDYWGYFVFIRDRSYLGEGGLGNQVEITPYLGRVNFVSLFPSLLFAAGAVSGLISILRRAENGEANRIYLAFCLIFIFVTLAGYLWFLLSYPVNNGATIKTTYILQIFVPLSLLAAETLERIRIRNRRAYAAVLFVLAGVFAHNLPAMITRYSLLA